MRRLLVWALSILIVLTVVNDLGRYIAGFQKADDAARAAAFAGARSGGKLTLDNAWKAAYAAAEQQGARAENIDLDERGVTVWVAYDVRGTWILAPAAALLSGQTDPELVWSTPLTVRSDARSSFD